MENTKTKLFTPLSILAMVISVLLVWHGVDSYLQVRIQNKHRMEIHNLNVEKAKLEIEILKQIEEDDCCGDSI